MTSTVAASENDLSGAATLRGGRAEIRPLTGLRFFAAAWVVLFHLHFTPGGDKLAFFTTLQPVIGLGALGVDLFFVLSGFVIALTYLDSLGPRLRPRAALRFVWARFSRVWPVFAVVTNLFGAWLLAKSVWGADGKIAFQTVQPDLGPVSWLRQMFLVQLWSQRYFDGSSWVGPAWSISAEWLAYLLFPVLALGFFRAARAPGWLLGAFAVAVMVPTAAVALAIDDLYYPFSWLVRIAAGFSSGVLVYLAVRNVRLTGRVRRLAGAAAVLVVLAAVAVLVANDLLGGDGRGGVIVVLFPVLVGALALARGGVVRPLGSGAAVHGGRISYSLYLVHVPVLEVTWTAMLRYPAIAPGTAAGLAVTVAAPLAALLAAHLLYQLVEEPSRRGLRRLVERRRTPEAAAAT
ncbi:MAG TPA: acyltransferase [Pseudonocardia sp.]